ncbi:hypothetical protein LTR15_002982 [Elasticomyces elasticus]|nr:hypothetical protein LTR15_002982 [Elasticomyces elasticus]
MDNDLGRLAREHDKAKAAPSAPAPEHIPQVKLEDESPDATTTSLLVSFAYPAQKSLESRSCKREGTPIEGQPWEEHNKCTKRIKLEDEEVNPEALVPEQGAATKQEPSAMHDHATPPPAGMTAKAAHPSAPPASTGLPERDHFAAADRAAAQANERRMASPAYQYCRHAGTTLAYRTLNPALAIR